jgi:hypothetical protein
MEKNGQIELATKPSSQIQETFKNLLCIVELSKKRAFEIDLEVALVPIVTSSNL